MMLSEVITELTERYGLKPPQKNSTVHNSECVYSTDTEKSPDGIYINLRTFQSFGRDMLVYDRDGRETLYLHVRKILVPVSPHEEEASSDCADDQNAAVYKAKKRYEEVLKCEICSPDLNESIPLDQAPSRVAEICEAIISHAGYEYKPDEFVWEAKLEESKYAKHLTQVESPPMIIYDALFCERCGSTSNLWLNLSDGYVGCGRRNFDSGGCADGEEGAAIQHYNETGGIYPLAVKIGTISANSGDVYSYAPDEDMMVIDPYLAEHLAHFGLDVTLLKKTEKTLLQMEKEKNESHDWSNMNTLGSEVVYGPGLVGLDNLGNTCYLNSIMQMLANIDELSSFFVYHYDNIAKSVPPEAAPHNDFLLQFAKTIKSLVTDRVVNQQLELIEDYKKSCENEGIEYVEPEQYKNFSFKPSMLKHAIANVNSMFVNNEQQDAGECLSCVLNMLDYMSTEIKSRCKEPLDIKEILFFKTRQSIICEALNKIAYNDSETNFVSLSLLMDSKKPEELDVDETIELQSCFTNWQKENVIDYIQDGQNYYAVISESFMTLPRYLIAYMKRFYCRPDGRIEKINNHIVVPAEGILLETCVTNNREGYMVEHNNRGAKKAKTHMDSELFQTLLSMGFTEKLCKLACEKSGSSSVDTCVDWILSNMDSVSDDNIDISMNETGIMDQECNQQSGIQEAKLLNGEAENFAETLGIRENDTRATYKPICIISHIGSSANAGHYVCHSYKDGAWYTFNDSKVLKCDSIPISHGYIYLLEKVDDAQTINVNVNEARGS